jgi:hypothetical protein
MGICIAYLGKLRSSDLVPELVADVRARAEAAGWQHREMAELVASGTVTCTDLRGISLYPHKECEPLRFHFDAEGVFVNHFYHAMLTPGSGVYKMMLEALSDSMMLSRSLAAPADGKKAEKGAKGGGPHLAVAALPEDMGSQSFVENGRRYNWTKTQHAGPDVHIAVCEMIRHVKDRYAPDLEVKDDSGYFDDKDRDKLLGQLGYVDRLVSLAADAFTTAASSKNAPRSLGDLIDRANEELGRAKDKLH